MLALMLKSIVIPRICGDPEHCHHNQPHQISQQNAQPTPPPNPPTWPSRPRQSIMQISTNRRRRRRRRGRVRGGGDGGGGGACCCCGCCGCTCLFRTLLQMSWVLFWGLLVEPRLGNPAITNLPLKPSTLISPSPCCGPLLLPQRVLRLGILLEAVPEFLPHSCCCCCCTPPNYHRQQYLLQQPQWPVLAILEEK